MAGRVGVPTGGIEYCQKLNVALKDCRNCVHHKPRTSPRTNKHYVWCSGFKIKITDMKNAKQCTKFQNKHPKAEVQKAQKQLRNTSKA